MRLSVLLFARARELARTSRAEVEVPESASVADIRDALLQIHPELTTLSSSLLWAVNNAYVTLDHLVVSSDEVACFPPVSGG
ncbi:MAG: molybdopterin converting factor subunit 1 [Planctomycetaceae bacterium]|nr:molybdopterin converting factor subunit 1 [Planctomycetaceae bacterium]